MKGFGYLFGEREFVRKIENDPFQGERSDSY